MNEQEKKARDPKAMEVLYEWWTHGSGDERSWAEGAYDALSAAGLLATPEDVAVLKAADAWGNWTSVKGDPKGSPFDKLAFAIHARRKAREPRPRYEAFSESDIEALDRKVRDRETGLWLSGEDVLHALNAQVKS